MELFRKAVTKKNDLADSQRSDLCEEESEKEEKTPAES